MPLSCLLRPQLSTHALDVWDAEKVPVPQHRGRGGEMAVGLAWVRAPPLLAHLMRAHGGSRTLGSEGAGQGQAGERDHAAFHAS